MNSKKCAMIAVTVAIIVGGASFYGGTLHEKSSFAKQNLEDPGRWIKDSVFF